MNVEKMYAIAKSIVEDQKVCNVQTQITTIGSHLQQMVSQPNQAQHQTNLTNQLNSLKEQSVKSAYNDYPPLWKQVCDELGFTNLLGENFYELVNDVIRRNGITPSSALEEINEIKARIVALTAAVKQLITVLNSLESECEKLEDGQCELGVMIPRDAITESLISLSKEFKEINSIVSVYEEIATGSRSSVKVRTISSSDYGLFLDLLPEVAVGLAVGIERIVELYKKSLEIKRLKQELADIEVPDEPLGPLNVYMGNYMDEGIKDFSKTYIEENANNSTKERKHELEKELRVALNKIANRVDRGFHLEISYKPIAEEDELEEGQETETETEAENRKVHEKLSEVVSHQTFLKTTGKQVLFLEEDVSKLKDDMKSTKKKVVKKSTKKTQKE